MNDNHDQDRPDPALPPRGPSPGRRARQRAERHAAAQAASVARRKERRAPGRDDCARAAYYALLFACARAPEGTSTRRAALRIRRTMLALLERAEFDRAASDALAEKHAANLVADLDAWHCARFHEEGRRLGVDRGLYQPLRRSNGVAILPAVSADDAQGASE